MRSRLRSYTVTPAGWLVLMLTLAALVVLAVGPRHDEGPALVVLVICLLTIVAQAGGVRGAIRTLDEHRAEFRPTQRRAGEEVDQAEQERLWAAERERYREGN